MNSTDLSKYQNKFYKPGKNAFIRFLWYFTNILFLKNPLNVSNFSKVFILRIFGTKIGKGTIIKPSVSIKYPWRLKIGCYVWIGENVWIDNLADVEIGDNACISQGALLLTGNHDFKKTTFDLIVKPIIIEDGVWLGAKSVVVGGVICFSHSVLTVGSVALKNLEKYSIYKGNPAIFVKNREIN